MGTGLSAVYITKDAAQHLAASIRSVVRLVDEVLVVDSGSSDETVSIAEREGARVIFHPWSGFGAQRAFAVAAAVHDWVLIVDADEVLEADSARALREALAMADGIGGFHLRRKNYIGRREIRHGDWAGEWVLRLVNRQKGRYNPADLVHESWQCSCVVARLQNAALHHYTFSSTQEMLPKLQRYSELNAQKVAARGRSVGPWAPMSHALWAFFRGYMLRLGFLDGVEGGAIAWTTALGAYFKYAIARDLLAAQAGKRR